MPIIIPAACHNIYIYICIYIYIYSARVCTGFAFRVLGLGLRFSFYGVGFRPAVFNHTTATHSNHTTPTHSNHTTRSHTVTPKMMLEGICVVMPTNRFVLIAGKPPGGGMSCFGLGIVYGLVPVPAGPCFR